MTLKAMCAAAMEGRRVAMVTAYDALFARYAAEAGADCLLVGDSLGMVLQGHPDTLRVTLEQMRYHTECVVRGAGETVVVADLPFGTYQASPEDAMRAAAVLLGSGAQAVKLEGGAPMASTIRFLGERGVPVIGHIGLTPQSIHALGGFTVQGRGTEAADRLAADLGAVADAGAAMVVLECVPAPLGERLAAASPVPVIGIGAGPRVHGQVLVLHDVLGWTDRRPTFARNFAANGERPREALGAYVDAVRSGTFPAPGESYR